MKNLFLLMTAGAVSGFSQGQINFSNLPASFPDSTAVDRFVYLDTIGGTKLTGTNWVAQIYAAPGSGLPESSLVPITSGPARFYAPTITSRLGIWAGGARTIDNCPEAALSTLAIRVWDGTLFSTYEAAVAGGGISGDSGTFNYVPPTTPIFDPSLLNMYGFRAFAMVVPEPTTIGLSILGVAGLLLVRRRK